MIRRIVISLVLSMLLHVSSDAQKSETDSLKKTIDLAKTDSLKVEALHYAKIAGEVNLQVTALASLAGCQKDNGDKGFITTLTSLHRIVEENNMIPVWPDVYEFYAWWYAQQGDYKKAYEYHQLFKDAADKLSSDNVKNKISMLKPASGLTKWIERSWLSEMKKRFSNFRYKIKTPSTMFLVADYWVLSLS